LQTAAALEPNRSLLRSYLGKAFANVHDESRAEKELALARRGDTNDPTPWLYSGLLAEQQNRFNEGVEDLEKSLAHNDNRQVYRSRLLLDQDRAVRAASLATIYQNDGLSDVSLREAARSVTYDYASYSAHLFLANSFDALRDPTRFNLRYETSWFNELLLANLLAPVGAGAFSQDISQQEYARLFEADRLGLISDSAWRSDGQFRQRATQFGTLGNTAYALDLDYQHNDGIRPNNTLDRIEWYSTIKQQLSPQDTILLLTKYQDYHSGDNFQYYSIPFTSVLTNYFCNPFTGTLIGFPQTNVSGVRTNFTLDEPQQPLLHLGYHREWAPGWHTVVLAGRLAATQTFSDRNVALPVTFTQPACGLFVTGEEFDVRYQSKVEVYTAELNQIVQTERHTSVLGGRFQTGDFTTSNFITNSMDPVTFPSTNYTVKPDFSRISLYAYHTWELLDHCWLTAGLAYEHLTYPRNHRQIPIQAESATREELDPKAALVWSLTPQLTLRGIYTRSLGGVSYDESVRLEPTQLAGFSQSFRTLLSESVAGSVTAPRYETYGGALDLKLNTRTYLGVQAEGLSEDVNRTVGTFDLDSYPAKPSSTPQNLDYWERSISATLSQLISEDWSVGAQYRFTHSTLHTSFPALAGAVNVHPNAANQADLHQFTPYVLFNHSSGLFVRAEAECFWQHNSGYATPLPGDRFAQANFFIGYRFPRQFGDLTFGVLNATGGNYHLNPLNVYTELPRERVWTVRLRISL
jgi:hypothetical protein